MDSPVEGAGFEPSVPHDPTCGLVCVEAPNSAGVKIVVCDSGHFDTQLAIPL